MGYFKKVYKKAKNGLCLFNLTESALYLKISENHLVEILRKKDYIVEKTCFYSNISNVRKIIGHSDYKRGARLEDAPYTFDCSSFTNYCYSLIGVDLPRNSIQQSYYYLGSEVNPKKEIQIMDLVFTKGYINRYINDPTQGIGHVLMYTGKESHTFIHASYKKKNVIEEDAEKYLKSPRLVRIVRYLSDISENYIIVKSKNKNFETSDDIFWNIIYK